jgi:hypothetical protein
MPQITGEATEEPDGIPILSLERQTWLHERRLIKPNVERGVYPFSGQSLTRADVIWLLETHNKDASLWEQANKESAISIYDDSIPLGLDLRGAILSGRT